MIGRARDTRSGQRDASFDPRTLEWAGDGFCWARTFSIQNHNDRFAHQQTMPPGTWPERQYLE